MLKFIKYFTVWGWVFALGWISLSVFYAFGIGINIFGFNSLRLHFIIMLVYTIFLGAKSPAKLRE